VTQRADGIVEMLEDVEHEDRRVAVRRLKTVGERANVNALTMDAGRIHQFGRRLDPNGLWASRLPVCY
jgi:hypothetical protein